MTEVYDDKIGGFRILSKIRSGAGSQGTVYKAVCECDDFARCPRGTVVALKSMPADTEGDDRGFEKLRDRVETLAGLSHPNVVRYLGCYSVHMDLAVHHVIVQEFLEGETLSSKLAGCPVGLDSDEALRVVKGMVAGLSAAASMGIVHRDVKPANVFVCSDGSVKIIDFEVSRRCDTSVSTSPGNIVGSFDYMAPEFTDGAFVGDEMSDVFSAGVVMHEVFTGETPYPRGGGSAGRSSFAFFDRWTSDGCGGYQCGSFRVSYRIERVFSHARPVVMKALAPNRSRRFASFGDLAEALSRIQLRSLRSGERKYQILQLVGRGGFGEVFKARRDDGRLVAIKHLLKLEYASRFTREAKIMSELHDSCFVQLLEFVLLDRPGAQEAFLVMDFLPGMPGSSLRDAIRGCGGLGVGFDPAMAAFARYAHGLSVLHGRGIYHRDIKPSNLYFPKGHPELAAIMDLGIARDENGTKTTGQVPGTMDYMPPEIVLGSTRGDAAVDIYALGLCLYEALTGKKGFPRLPSGGAAFAKFINRAREMSRPDFSDERVTSRPQLLKLLVWMTEPDSSKRLSSAAALEAALLRLSAGEDIAYDELPTAATGTVVTEPCRQIATDASVGATGAAEPEPATCDTLFMSPSDVATVQEQRKDVASPTAAPSRRFDGARVAIRAAAGLGFAVALSCLAYFGYFFGPYICEWLNGTFVEQERVDYAPQRKVVSSNLGNDVLDVYGDDSISLAQADALRDRWLAERRPPALSQQEYSRLVGIFEEKRERRIVRDRLALERSGPDRDANEVARTYRDDGIEAGDAQRDAWFRAWGDTPESKTAAARRVMSSARSERQALDAAMARVPQAAEDASKIAKSYGTDDLSAADRNAETWRRTWRAQLPSQSFERLDRDIAEARKRVMDRKSDAKRAMAGKMALDMCRGLIETLTPVESRMSRLAEAETMLKSEVEAGRIDDETARALADEIAVRREWTVFEVVNRSGLELSIGGLSLPNGQTKVFVYTNAPPAELVAEHTGYEPFVFDTGMNGRSVTLISEHFTMLRVAMRAPSLQEGVVCRVDGVRVRGETVRLMPGTHECVYSLAGYRDQSIPFRVEPNTPSSLPSPGAWVRSDEWQKLQDENERKKRSESLERKISQLLADEPVTTRQARLKQCERLLSQWSTPAALGETKLAECRKRLKAAAERGVGAIVNDTRFELNAVFSDGSAALAHKGRTVVVFDLAKGPPSLEVAEPGYERIPLSSAFNGSEVRIADDAIRPLPVRVSLPEPFDEMTCVVDGVLAKGDIMVVPGNHVCVFRRPDYFDVRREFSVKAGESWSLPAPSQWKETDGLAALVAAEAAISGGDWSRAETLLSSVKVTGADRVRRMNEVVSSVKRHKKLLLRLDDVAAAYMDGRWKDVIDIYSELVASGHRLTDEDVSRITKAAKSAKDAFEMRRQSAERRGLRAEVEASEAGIVLLDRAVNAMLDPLRPPGK